MDVDDRTRRVRFEALEWLPHARCNVAAPWFSISLLPSGCGFSWHLAPCRKILPATKFWHATHMLCNLLPRVMRETQHLSCDAAYYSCSIYVECRIRWEGLWDKIGLYFFVIFLLCKQGRHTCSYCLGKQCAFIMENFRAQSSSSKHGVTFTPAKLLSIYCLDISITFT